MIRRWPIRIRLTAAFTVMMALVLAGVGAVTLAHTRSSLDASITESLTYRLADLRPIAATAEPLLAGGSQDTAEQVLGGAGQLVAATPELSGAPVLSPPELDAARRGALLVDHPTAGTLPGPVRIAATGIDAGRVVIAAVSLADRDAAVADLRRELEIGFPLVLIAAAVGAYLLAAAALRPVERMRARAATLTAADPQQHLPVPAGRDELSRLGDTFNDLLARLHTALTRERQFVTDAGHELRTPLSLLTTELELALRRPRSPGELTAALRSALEETGRLSRLAADLLQAGAEPPTTGHRPPMIVELRPLLETVIGRHRTPSGRQICLDCPPGLTTTADRDDLHRMLDNLLDNADGHGAPPITIHAHAGDTGSITIEVCDHGPGFDPAFLPHAFDRFTRADTARTGGGSGLGLAIVAALTRRNHGTVTAANQPDSGAVLTLTLPAR